MRRGGGTATGRTGGWRAAAAAAGALALALGAAGCNGSSGGGSSASSSGPASSGSSSTSSAPASSSSSGPMTKDQAEALAAAINLKRSDLPGYRATPSTSSGEDSKEDERLNRCAGGVPDSKDIAKEDSPDFSTGSGTRVRQVSSTVSVLPTAALAAKDLAAVKSTRGRTCFRTFVNALLARAGNGQVSFSKARVTAFQPATNGTDGAFGYRVRVTARGNGIRIPFFVDGLGFTKGPVEVALNVVSIGKRFPTSDEQRLLTVLVNRAQGQAS